MSTPATTPKNMRKLWDRLNRIKNLTPGTTRIWRLGEVRDELQISLDMGDVHPDSRERIEALVLFIERLQFDLHILNEVVHEKKARDGRPSRNDPTNWLGERP